VLPRGSILRQRLISRYCTAGMPWHRLRGQGSVPVEHQLGPPGRAGAASRRGAGGSSQGREQWARLGWLPRAIFNCGGSHRAWKHCPLQESRSRCAGARICTVRREDPVTCRGAKAPPAGSHRPLSQRRLKLGTMAEVRSAAAADSALHAPCCHQRRCLCLPRCCAHGTQQRMHCVVQLPPAPDAAAHMRLRPAPPAPLPCCLGGTAARHMAAGMVAIAGQPLFGVLGGGGAHPTAAALAGLTASHLALPALYPADSHSPRRAPRCARLPPAGLQPLLHLLLPAFAAFHACLLDTPLICFALPAARLAGHKGWVTSIAAPLDPSADVLLSSSR
jgi:hypothetical protein